MISSLQLLLADISDLPWVAIVAVGGSMLVSVFVPICWMYFHHQKRQLWHETARIALEKGQPMPAMPEIPDATVREAIQHDREQRNDIRRGLILIAVGGGLYLFLNALVGQTVGLVGAIPGFIGVALLLFGVLSAVFQRKDPPPAARP